MRLYDAEDKKAGNVQTNVRFLSGQNKNIYRMIDIFKIDKYLERK